MVATSRPLRLENLEGRLTPASASPVQWQVGQEAYAPAPKDVVFVDEYLLDQVPQQELSGREVVTINGYSDAISQITQALAGKTGVGTIRLISHGESGALLLGNQVIDQRVLSARSSEIAAWGSSLTPDADLLLYGCSVASTEDGTELVDYLARLTGADVAASTNLTGALGGDTTLEYTTGLVTSQFGASLSAWNQAGLQLLVNDVVGPNQRSGAGAGLTTGAGQSFPNLTAFAVINRDGSVTAWGDSAAGGAVGGSTGVPASLSAVPASGAARPLQLVSNEQAFAALMSDGSVVAWGNASFGASNAPASVTAAGSNVIALYSTQNGFAALKSDNSIVWWSGTTDNGTRSAPGGAVTINGIYSTQRAFAALRSDGTVDFWDAGGGGPNYGGTLNAGLTMPSAVTAIYTNQRAFTAIGTLGGVAGGYTIWGDTGWGGGKTYTAPAAVNAVTLVTSNERAFAFIVGTKVVQNEGDAQWGATAFTASGSDIVDLVATERAFCVIYNDGSIGVWGPATPIGPGNYGGIINTSGTPTGVVKVVATGEAFAAFNSAGNLVQAWGNGASGTGAPGSLTSTTQIVSTSKAFAALKSDGSIVAWGEGTHGGTGAPSGTGFAQIFATGSAFTGLKTSTNNGTVSSWGAAGAGGTTPSSGINRAVAFASSYTDNPWFTNAESVGYEEDTGTKIFNLVPVAFPGNISVARTGGDTLPTGVTLAPNGTLTVDTNTATPGIYNFFFTATNTSANNVYNGAVFTGSSTDYNFQLTIGSRPAFQDATATTNFTVFANGSYTPVMSSIGIPAATFSMTGAPAWASINATTGEVTGNPPAGSVGTYNFTITATNFIVAVNQAVTLNVVKATPTITWSDPANIVYGTLLSATQLNAVLNIPSGGSAGGAATYTPASGTMLDAGKHSLQVDFAATADYNQSTATVNITVDKANQDISWSDPANIVYGTLLSGTQLNATVSGVSGGSAPGALTYNPAAGALLDAGTQTLTVTAAATANYNQATKSVTLIVDKADQVITWANPADIVYGTLLDSTQLNATVAGVTGGSAPGALTYNPAAGTLLDAGTQTLTVNAAATSNYNAASKQVSIVVNKADQTINWSDPANIVYGTLLSGTQLNATVSGVSGGSAPGALTYNPDTGAFLDAGSHTLTVTAAATANYNQATKQVTLVVDKADQIITWSDPANIVYGTLLSATQLNATVAGVSGGSAPGALTYNPDTGAFLDAGSHTLTVTAAATSNYNQATKQVTLVVDKADQTIDWSNPADIVYGTLLSGTQLNATVAGVPGGSSPGGLTYNPAAGTLLDAGTQTLTVTAAATSNYNEATKQVTLIVNKADQTITWSDPANIVYGTLLSGTQLNATVAGVTGGSAPGALTYNPAAGTLLDAGSHTLTVTAAATSNYNEATKQVTLVVDKADQTITWADPANIIYGTLLSSTQLNATVAGVSGGSAPGALTYNPDFNSLLNAGSHTLSVTAAATPNYNEATKSVSLTVDKFTPTLAWPSSLADIVYGTLLSSTQLDATVSGSSTPGTDAPSAIVYTVPPGQVVTIGTLLAAGTWPITITSAASANYNEVTQTRNLTVNKADQTITWARPAAITYGTLLSSTQLNATVAGVTGGTAPGALTYNPAAGTLLDAGTQSLTVTAAATDNYNEATFSVLLQVNRAAQNISWATPAAITYGTLLDSTQLNATVTGVSGGSPTGTVSYTPAAGTLLDAGKQTLTVNVAGTGNYLPATASVELVVNKADQTISWADPSAITYGTKLSSTQLNATASGVSGGSAPGALTYTPGAGTILDAGTNTLTVVAAATTNYNEATKQVSILVNKADQTITWSTPAAITYGTLLSGTQLNATVAGVTGGSAPGALTYNPVAGTMLNAGSQLLTVTAAATSNYNEATKSVSLLVNKADQTITWSNPANVLNGTALSSTQLNATVAGVSGGSAPGALTYTPPSGTVMTTNGPNTLTVVAAATSNYNQATKQVTLVVDQAPTITSGNATTFTVGTPGNFLVTSTGYPARTYSVTGTLPGGVSLNTSNGILSGTPVALSGGIYPVVFGATNGISPDASQKFTLTVNEAPNITSASSTTFLEGVAGTTFQVTATGFPAPTFSIIAGTLPDGLTFNGTTGVVSGTPAIGILGSYNVTVQASNVVTTATQVLTINVWRNVPVATGAQLTTPFNLGAGSYVVSLGNGSVLINNPNGTQQTFTPFPGFTRTLSTSLVDRNGDGTADSILVAVANNAQPAVLVLDAATGRVAYNFYAFDPGFFGGVTVAGGITKFQGKVTTVVIGAAGPGAEPSVSAFDAVTGQFRSAFYAFDPRYTGGVRVAMTGPDSTGQSLVVASPAINSNIVTFTLDNPNRALSSFYAFNPPDLYVGTWVAAGDLDGDGVSELVVGAGPGTNGRPEVSVFDLRGNLLKNFLAFGQGFSGGVSVAVSDYNKDGKGDIFASSGAGAQATFNVFGYPALNLIDAVFLPTTSLLGTFVANNPSAGSSPITGGT